MPGECCVDRPIHGQRNARRTSHLIAELAGRQHGIVERGQLLRLGISADVIDGRLRSGLLHRLHRGVYAVGHRVVSRQGRWLAATFASGAGSALSHRAGGAHWELRGWSGWPEVSTPRSRRVRAGIILHRARLPADELTHHDGIPVTTVARTLFDLASLLDRPALESAIDEAQFRRLGGPLSLPDLLARHPGARGAANLGAILAAGAVGFDRTETDLEELFAALIERHGLPRPRINEHVTAAGRTFRVDCSWTAQRLIVELDGRQAHGAPPAFQADRERDRALTVAGWRVIRLTFLDLTEHEASVVSDLRRALSDRVLH